MMNQICDRQLKLDGNENHQLHCRWIHPTDNKCNIIKALAELHFRG